MKKAIVLSKIFVSGRVKNTNQWNSTLPPAMHVYKYLNLEV